MFVSDSEVDVRMAQEDVGAARLLHGDGDVQGTTAFGVLQIEEGEEGGTSEYMQ